jgi:hypothetical protein
MNVIRERFTVEQTENESADTGTMTNRKDKIQFLVENHGFKEESLNGMGDACLERTYESFNEDNEDESDESLDANELADELETRFEDQFVTEDDLAQAVNQVEEERKKRNLADKIAANSKYEDADDVLDDFPTKTALETKHDDVTEDDSAANFAAQPGASADTGSADADGMPALTASKRLEELEGDD